MTTGIIVSVIILIVAGAGIWYLVKKNTYHQPTGTMKGIGGEGSAPERKPE